MTENGWFTIDSSQSPFFLRNLDLFRVREPEQARLVEESAARLVDWEFCEEGKGQFVCRERNQAALWYDPAFFHGQLKNKSDWAVQQFQRGKELLTIAGVGLGYFAAAVELAIRGNLENGVLLLETRPEWIAAQFCLFDRQRLIQSNEVFWAVGDPLLETVEKVFTKYRLDLVPAEKIAPIQERRLDDREKQDIQRLGGQLAQRWRETQSRLSKIKKQFNIQLSQPPCLQRGKIWAISTPDAYAHNPLIESLMDGFEQIGWRTQVLHFRDGFGAAAQIIESLMEAAPDVILVCNTASNSFFSPNIHRPCLDWFLDYPRYYAGEGLAKNLALRDYVFYIDRDYGKEFERSAAGGVQFLPACASIRKRGEFRRELAAPVLFAGAYSDATAFYQNMSPQSREEIEEILDALIRDPKKTGCETINSLNIAERTFDLIRRSSIDCAERVKEHLTDEALRIDYFLYSLANGRKREKIVRALLDLGLVVYGPESWLKVLGERHASQYRGWLAADDLADAYASADVVLNIHSLQCPTCLNPRDFDVLAAGGCLAADWVQDMEEGFVTPGADCISIREIHQFKETVQNLLGDADYRAQLREQGHAAYLARHTTRHRAEAMQAAIQGYFRIL